MTCAVGCQVPILALTVDCLAIGTCGDPLLYGRVPAGRYVVGDALASTPRPNTENRTYT